MSVNDCIRKKVEAGLLDADEAVEILDLIQKYEAAHGRRAQPAFSDTIAAQQALEDFTKNKHVQRYQTFLRLKRQLMIGRRIDEHTRSPMDGALALFDRDIRDIGAQDNVQFRRQAVRGQALGLMGSVLEDFRPRLMRSLGRNKHGKATDDEIHAALRGERTNQAATDLAEAFNRVNDWLIDRYRAAGGVLARRKDWLLPHVHDTDRMLAAGRDAWINTVMPLLDRTKMVDNITGRQLADDELRELLDEAFDTITTNGRNKLTPSSRGTGRKKLANQRFHSRMLHFAGDDWVRYNEQFGREDVFATMLNHIEDMSHDIARLEMFGPNEEDMVRYMVAKVEQSMSRAGQDSRSAREKILRSWDEINGNALAVVDRGKARSFTAARNVLTSAQLGSAFLLALPGDFMTARMAAAYNGMPMTKMVRNYVDLIRRDPDAKALAIRAGLVSESYSSSIIAAQRFTNDLPMGGLTSRLSDATLRFSGLTGHTDAAREAFSLAFATHLGEHLARGFDELPAELQRFLDTYGIGADDWAVVRQAEFPERDGMPVVTIGDIARLEDQGVAGAGEIATRLHQGILSESSFGVVTSSNRTERILRFGQKRGTWFGELAQSLAMYKRFPVQVLHTHWARALLGSRITPLEKARYLSQLVVGLTVMGAFGLQMREIAAGRDPLDSTTADFWMAAMVNGGGLSIFGDFIYNSFTGQDFAERNAYQAVLGPVFGGVGGDAIRTINSVAKNIVDGETAEQTAREFAGDIINQAGRYTPVLSSLWYLKTAFRHSVIQQLEQAVDPDAADRYERIIQRAQRDRDQAFFWEPGQPQPYRAPDFSNVLGQN